MSISNSTPRDKSLHGLLALLGLDPAHGARVLGVLLDKTAGGKSLPELAHERAGLAVVVVTDDGLDSCCGLLCVVEGDAGKNVVDNMEADDAASGGLAYSSGQETKIGILTGTGACQSSQSRGRRWRGHP